MIYILIISIYNKYMRFQDVEATLIKCDHRTGISGPAKGSKPYDFYTIELVDGEYNKFESVVPRSATIDGVVPEWIREAKDVKVILDVEFKPIPAGRAFNITVHSLQEE